MRRQQKCTVRAWDLRIKTMRYADYWRAVSGLMGEVLRFPGETPPNPGFLRVEGRSPPSGDHAWPCSSRQRRQRSR